MIALSKIIPPPKFLTMPCVGVDISDTSLKYVSFYPSSQFSNERKLKSWGNITIPNGIVQRGRVEDEEKLAAVLREFKIETGAEFIRVSLPEERAYLFETSIKKGTPLKEIRGLLEFRLEENVPIPSKDVFFDYDIINSEAGKSSIQIAVAAYAKETILKYYNACITAGLHPVSFEVEAQAVARAVIPADSAGAAMIVDFGKTRTGIGIAYKGVLLYTSTIDIGGGTLSKSLRQTLGEDTSEAELTKLKNTQGLVRGVDSSDVYDTLIGTVSMIKDELVTRMQYWHLRNGDEEGRRITSVQLTGGSSNLKGLPAYLTETLGIPCVRANVWENAFSLDENVPPISRRKSFGYSTAIGLGLEDVL
jgi:type IV pilus assembly protein PilM